MHKDDQMTPKERLLNFSKGKEIDRIPIIPFLGTIGGKISGMSLKEGRLNSKNEALMQIACYERLGNDLLTIDYGLHGIGIALGSKTNDPEDDIPAITEFILNDLSDVNKLDIYKCSSSKDINLKNHLEASEILLDKLSVECGVDVTIPGPFTAAASIYPIEKLLRATKKSPELVHQLLRLCNESLKSVCSEFAKLGVTFTICDPVASCNIISLDNYIQFVKPYTIELVEYLHNLNTDAGYHICGNTSKILTEMVNTGVDLLSLDSAVDLEFAKQTVGSQICLVGNVDPVNIILLGNKEQIFDAVKNCFIKASDSPNGFIIATGCDIPSRTSLENVDAFMEASRKYGKWPLSNFKGCD